MKNKKSSTEEFWQEQPQTYQTGSTNPPKNYGGIIAFLLVLVIFLCGISTALGLMNIRLFRELSSIDAAQETGAVSFAEAPKVSAGASVDSAVQFPLGFTGQGVPDFWQHYNGLPQGVYITCVESGSCAEKSGLLPGDVLTQLDGIPVPDPEALRTILDSYTSGQSLDAQICREGNNIAITLTID